MNLPNRERRDWTLIIFILPIGIILILIVGQIAIRMVPHWSVDAGMESNLDPNSEYIKPISLLQPLLPQILTPFAWAENYLTPMGDVSFPQFFVIEPSYTPSPTEAAPNETQVLPPTSTETPVPSATTPPVPTGTQLTSTPPVEESETPDPTSTVSPTVDPTEAPTEEPTEVPTEELTEEPTEEPTPSATPTGTPVTPDGTFMPPPTQINLDAPDNDRADIENGDYTVIDLGGNPVIVLATPDNFYDLIFYEYVLGGTVFLDHIIIGISDFNDGSQYYEVFNWGNPEPDTNTNVNTDDLPPPVCPQGFSEPECDNREFSPDDLYPYPGTGILIDVDLAPGMPPAGLYNFIVIIAPNTGGGDPAQVDAIVVTEVPIPPAPPAPLSAASDRSSSLEAEVTTSDEVLSPPEPEPIDSPPPNELEMTDDLPPNSETEEPIPTP